MCMELTAERIVRIQSIILSYSLKSAPKLGSIKGGERGSGEVNDGDSFFFFLPSEERRIVPRDVGFEKQMTDSMSSGDPGSVVSPSSASTVSPTTWYGTGVDVRSPVPSFCHSSNVS